jgi:hypothetical protein
MIIFYRIPIPQANAFNAEWNNQSASNFFKMLKKIFNSIIFCYAANEVDEECFAMDAENNEKIPCVFPFIYKGKKSKSKN